ncbi:chaperone protein [uncultured Desulfovibrio sp.]|uniref:chaperone protein n=1 Tax=uncultured Desulfovibrio sp. TaxID=167968 RepID=UPI002868C51F|nr:chaperone protein [uncultured Desulfovibrio sp.]
MAQNTRVDDYTTCPACQGKGKDDAGMKCFECNGTGKKQQACTVPEGPEHEGVCD